MNTQKIEDNSNTKGLFKIKQIRNGIVIDEWESPNLIVKEGRGYYQNAALDGLTQKAAWYLGLFAGARDPVDTDTGANVSANSTEISEYDEATREVWTPDAALDDSTTYQTIISNSNNPATFTLNDSVTINGLFMASESTIDGSSGTSILIGETRFSSARSAISGDEIVVTYQINITGSV